MWGPGPICRQAGSAGASGDAAQWGRSSGVRERGVSAISATPLPPSRRYLAVNATTYGGSAGGGAADGERIDAERRLADAHRHALAILAAGADAGIERHVVADHADAGERLGARANQRRALDRLAELAVLDQVTLGDAEHELARDDVDLAAAEVGAVEALLDGGNDLLGILVAAQHEGVGHARHRRIGVALPSAVAGRLHTHQARIHAVLHQADQSAVLDQHVP